MSPPAREAWIEIANDNKARHNAGRRLPRGRRGLKYRPLLPTSSARIRRLPRGRRGLKCTNDIYKIITDESPPAREAWIEIARGPASRRAEGESPPAREAWIEIFPGFALVCPVSCRLPRGRRGLKFRPFFSDFCRILSPPAREAWIEISDSICSGSCALSRRPRGRRGLKSRLPCGHP